MEIQEHDQQALSHVEQVALKPRSLSVVGVCTMPNTSPTNLIYRARQARKMPRTSRDQLQQNVSGQPAERPHYAGRSAAQQCGKGGASSSANGPIARAFAVSQLPLSPGRPGVDHH